MASPGSSAVGSPAAPRVGIVVLNYRQADRTIACLGSLRALRYPNAEVVAVDNGSGDGSAERIRLACPGVHLIESPRNLGYAGGNALGHQWFRSRSAELLWILNNDTTVHPDALAHLVAEVRKNPKLGAVGSLVMDARGGGVLAAGGGRMNLWLGTGRHVTDPAACGRLDYVTGASMLVPMRVFEAVGFLDDSYFLYYEDADFGFRLRASGFELGLAPGSIVFHDESSTLGRSSPALCFYMNRSFVRFVVRHAPFYPLSLAAGVSARLAKRVLTGRFGEARVLLAAVRAGWRERNARSTAIEEAPVAR